MVEFSKDLVFKKSFYDLKDFQGTERAGVNLFTLNLEREKVKNYEKYTGYFVCDKKNLKVVATRGEFTVVMV